MDSENKKKLVTTAVIIVQLAIGEAIKNFHKIRVYLTSAVENAMEAQT